MTSIDDQQTAANHMAAFAHLLCGQPGRAKEFLQNAELILSVFKPPAIGLMAFEDRVRRTGRPVIWICQSKDGPSIPSIGLVAMADHQAFTIENCFLWLSAKDDRARLIPDSFEFGSFMFGDDLRLRHIPKVPARNWKSSIAAMSRAYSRLREIEAEQRRRGEVFPLPELIKGA